MFSRKGKTGFAFVFRVFDKRYRIWTTAPGSCSAGKMRQGEEMEEIGGDRVSERVRASEEEKNDETLRLIKADKNKS